MSRVCEICGKRTHTGNNVTRRGLAKHKGGVGIKTTSITKRKFKPNIQKLKMVVNGTVKRIKVCTQCVRSGNVAKPVKYVTNKQ
ncbi:MAG: 50S ribosomal protein L28 [Planctomycetota bacterium]